MQSIGVACGCLGYAKSAKGHKYAQFGSTRKHNDEEVLRGKASHSALQADAAKPVRCGCSQGVATVQDSRMMMSKGRMTSWLRLPT